MLGLGSNITKAGKIGKPIVKDGLVLKHGYAGGPVQPCSTGAVDINADAAANEYIDVGTTTNIGTSDISFSAWVYITSFVNYGGIFGARQATDPWPGFEVRTMDENTIQVVLRDGDSSASMTSSVLNTNQWYHIGVSIDRDGGAGGAQLYIDGVMDGDDNPDPDQASIGSIGITTRIGQHYSGGVMRGYICNVGYWLGTALTQAKIKSIMHKDYAGLSASEKTNLVNWWNLDSTMITNPFDGDKFGVLDSHYGGGSELGSEMWDGTNGDTTHWVKFGSNNEISSDDGAVKITYKDDASGYYVYLKDDSHLTDDLVVGKFYRLTFSTKINNGSVTWSLKDEDADSWKTDALTSTSFITQQIDFVATATEDHYIYPAFMDGSEEVWIKDISLKLINGNHGTLA